MAAWALEAGAGEELIMESLRYAYYSVSGASMAQIRHSLLQSPLRSPDGRVAFGLTDARFGFQSATAWVKGQGCRFVPPYHVTLDLVVTLPELDQSTRLSGSEQAQWNRYEKELRDHEMIHVEDSRASARELLEWVEAYRQLDGCAGMEKVAKEAMDQLATDNRARATLIDRVVETGLRQ